MSDNTDFDKTIFPYTKQLTDKLPNVGIKFIDRIEANFLFRIKEFAPKRTGAYSRSWKTKSKSIDKIVFWTTQPDLYVILEFGANAHEILPNTARVLRFVDSAGNVVFTMRVEHPGIKARPHARPAMEDTIRDAIDILLKVVMEEITWLQRA